MTIGGGFHHDAHHLAEGLLGGGAASFLTDLQRRFGTRREQLLEGRRNGRRRIEGGERLTFRAETEPVRRQRWSIAAPPKDLEDRRVGVTGSPDAATMIEGLNSGARVFIADFENACSPSWGNVLAGQAAIRSFYRDDLTAVRSGVVLRPGDEPATLVVGVRGWHQVEPHARVDGGAMSASLFDFGLTAFHNGRASLDGGSGPYFSLPKLESHLEARLWADVIRHAEELLSLDRGSIRVTVVIETLPAAFEMDEILFELRDRACALTAGRSDYLASVVKTFRHDPSFVLPDRSDVGMDVPFMRAFGELMVSTCHRRGAHAIGGVTAALPDFSDPTAAREALGTVTADNRREAGNGFDGTLVAHTDAVAPAMAEFDRVLGGRSNQLEVQRDDVYITPGDLLAVRSTDGTITEEGVRANIRTGIRYLAAWLAGCGTVAVDDVVVDMSAAEFSRVQLWQWIRHRTRLSNGQVLTRPVTRHLIDDEMDAIWAVVGDETGVRARFDDARRLFERLTLTDELSEFVVTAIPPHTPNQESR
jgi:malate synthase